MIKVYQSPAPLGQRALMAKREHWTLLANTIGGRQFHQPPAAMTIRRALAVSDEPLVRIIMSREEADVVLKAAG